MNGPILFPWTTALLFTFSQYMIEMRTYNYADLCDRFLDRPPTLLDTRPTTNNCFAEMKSTRELLKLRSPTRGVDHPDQIVSTANFPGSGIGFKR